jgi:Flp pilus assembly protein TadB
MADLVKAEEEREGTAPPIGEEIHMPAPSILPLINAAALALAIVSVTLSWVLVIVFGILFLLTTIRWIADTRRDIAELPLDHSSH